MLKQPGLILPRCWRGGSLGKAISALCSHPLGKKTQRFPWERGHKAAAVQGKPHSKETGWMAKNKKSPRKEGEITDTSKFRTAAKKANRGGAKLSTGL